MPPPRRRRSYCSKEKPTCSRCRDAGLECVYEGARKVLVNETYLRELEAKSKALDKVLAGGAPKDGEQDAEAGQAKQHHHDFDEHEPLVALTRLSLNSTSFQGPASSDSFLRSVRKLSGLGEGEGEGLARSLYEPDALPSRRQVRRSRLPPIDIARRLFAAQYMRTGAGPGRRRPRGLPQARQGAAGAGVWAAVLGQPVGRLPRAAGVRLLYRRAGPAAGDARGGLGAERGDAGAGGLLYGQHEPARRGVSVHWQGGAHGRVAGPARGGGVADGRGGRRRGRGGAPAAGVVVRLQHGPDPVRQVGQPHQHPGRGRGRGPAVAAGGRRRVLPGRGAAALHGAVADPGPHPHDHLPAAGPGRAALGPQPHRRGAGHHDGAVALAPRAARRAALRARAPALQPRERRRPRPLLPVHQHGGAPAAVPRRAAAPARGRAGGDWREGLSPTTVRVVDMCVGAAQDVVNMMAIAAQRDMVGDNVRLHGRRAHLFRHHRPRHGVRRLPPDAASAAATETGLGLLRAMGERGNSHMGARYELLASLHSPPVQTQPFAAGDPGVVEVPPAFPVVSNSALEEPLHDDMDLRLWEEGFAYPAMDLDLPGSMSLSDFMYGVGDA
ncbi:hypothetical protein ACCO45_013533 [Purpureocillium lilacinum]|uniref:Uncharacterized protein n=1 Tax=Purpureocillium lilacinum TaxID=33203 RepID=A0ACC4D6I0_PURLI